MFIYSPEQNSICRLPSFPLSPLPLFTLFLPLPHFENHVQFKLYVCFLMHKIQQHFLKYKWKNKFFLLPGCFPSSFNPKPVPLQPSHLNWHGPTFQWLRPNLGIVLVSPLPPTSHSNPTRDHAGSTFEIHAESNHCSPPPLLAPGPNQLHPAPVLLGLPQGSLVLSYSQTGALHTAVWVILFKPKLTQIPAMVPHFA